MRQCPECDDTGLVSLGPTNLGGPNVSERCDCRPPEPPRPIINPDDMMDAAQARLDRIDTDGCEVAT